jgi:hypothetical protein
MNTARRRKQADAGRCSWAGKHEAAHQSFSCLRQYPKDSSLVCYIRTCGLQINLLCVSTHGGFSQLLLCLALGCGMALGDPGLCSSSSPVCSFGVDLSDINQGTVVIIDSRGCRFYLSHVARCLYIHAHTAHSTQHSTTQHKRLPDPTCIVPPVTP